MVEGASVLALVAYQTTHNAMSVFDFVGPALAGRATFASEMPSRLKPVLRSCVCRATARRLRHPWHFIRTHIEHQHLGIDAAAQVDGLLFTNPYAIAFFQTLAIQLD